MQRTDFLNTKDGGFYATTAKKTKFGHDFSANPSMNETGML